ncbi:MAG: IS110 family transposase [Alphaproteobacteria bacterium]|nr:IS110 family transposase [Alphaproteobacteria bacterium]
MEKIIIGIDISKLTFNVALLVPNQPIRCTEFSNDQKGFQLLHKWLNCRKIAKAHICMEATGGYEEALAQFFFNYQYDISIVNPARTKAYSRSLLARNKTDKIDSLIIAQFCLAQNPNLWMPQKPELQEIKILYRCLQGLKEDDNRIRNRLEKLSGKSPVVIEVMERNLTAIKESKKKIEAAILSLLKGCPELKNQYELLKTIPGISNITATALLAELPDIKVFDKAKQVGAFAGLTPSHRTSGTSVRGSSLSKVGSSTLRKLLYMPAIVAMRRNPIIQKFCHKLLEKGKHIMLVIAAAMRKLLQIAYGVLKSKQPFKLSLNS